MNFMKFQEFHDFMKKSRNYKLFGIFMKKHVFSPREAPRYMRNYNKYKGFRAGGRGGDENLPFSLISIGFHEIGEIYKKGDFT